MNPILIDWQPILHSGCIKHIFQMRLVCKEWLSIIKYVVFTSTIKYKNIDKITYLKQISLNIRLECTMCDYNKVTDVSALSGLTTLNISGCRGVTDVSALGGLTTLDMRGCTGVTNKMIFFKSVSLECS